MIEREEIQLRSGCSEILADWKGIVEPRAEGVILECEACVSPCDA
jgi:hypothetical protein